jgi:hypothetical protein
LFDTYLFVNVEGMMIFRLVRVIDPPPREWR